MVEGVHARVLESLIGPIAVPTLPDRGRALGHGVQPTRVSRLKQQLLGNVGVSGHGERLHESPDADKAGREVPVTLLNQSDEPVAEFPLHRVGHVLWVRVKPVIGHSEGEG